MKGGHFKELKFEIVILHFCCVNSDENERTGITFVWAHCLNVPKPDR